MSKQLDRNNSLDKIENLLVDSASISAGIMNIWCFTKFLILFVLEVNGSFSWSKSECNLTIIWNLIWWGILVNYVKRNQLCKKWINKPLCAPWLLVLVSDMISLVTASMGFGLVTYSLTDYTRSCHFQFPRSLGQNRFLRPL